MKKEEIAQQDFHSLMQTQQLSDLPSYMEEFIMQKINVQPKPLFFPIQLSSIFVFSFLICLYVIIQFVSTYYYPHQIDLIQFNQFVLLSIIVFVLYELNDMISNRIATIHFDKRKMI
jgi:hypothetical protein